MIMAMGIHSIETSSKTVKKNPKIKGANFRNMKIINQGKIDQIKITKNNTNIVHTRNTIVQLTLHLKSKMMHLDF